jgi:hypothetical protein
MKLNRFLLLFFVLFSELISLHSQGKDEYFTDVFGAKIYKNGDYEEKIWVDVFGDKQFSNNRGESASLKKNIFDDRIYEDNRSNEVKINKIVWVKMLKDVHGDEDALFYDLIAQNNKQSGSKVSIEIDIMGKEIYKDNNLTQEFWVDIMDTQQYRNSDGQTASLRKDISGNMNYSDSKGNCLIFTSDAWQREYRHTGGRERSVFRQLIKKYLF